MHCIDRIRVRVVHNDPVAEAGLSAAFSRYPDLEVEAVAEGFGETKHALRSPGRRTADVVVADYSHGMELALQATRESGAEGSPKIVILAGVDREWEIRSALARGVRGYLVVGCALDELADGVRAVHRGARHLSPRVAARLAESMAVEPLTAREEEVLRLVVEGMCNKAIGRQLGIAVGTVKSHLKSTFDKLDVQSRTQAVAAVERRGLLREHPQVRYLQNEHIAAPAPRIANHATAARSGLPAQCAV
jgi:DNA-binding NarL/FixJ family response regulator